jgi:hypothetical protein
VASAGRALALLWVLPLLAGCVAPGNAVSDAPLDPAAGAGLAVAPSHLEAGTFYAFRHAGGNLGLGVLPGGRAQVELFDGDDQRLGQISLSDALAGGTLQLQNMPAGDYVVRTLVVNGTLRIDSGGAAPALRPLASHVERHILMQKPRGAIPTVGLPGSSQPAESPLDIKLLRAPTSLRVLVAGDFASLDVELHSSLGPVLEAHATGFSPFTGLGRGGFADLGGEVHGENVRDGHLLGRVQAQDLRGAIVLEAASFSRAEPLAPPATPTQEAARFTYGTLPDVPVRFQTGPRATEILLHGEPFPGGNQTWVTLFDDHGHRLGTLSLRTGATLAVPAAASTGYVAVRQRGNATLGANGAPGDFEMHPMQVHEQVLPASGAGGNGEYGQAEADADGTGLFAVEPTLARPTQGPFGFDPAQAQQCGIGGQVRITQQDETLGAWDDEATQLERGSADLRLRDGPLKVLDDGFGGAGCPYVALRLKSFAG